MQHDQNHNITQNENDGEPEAIDWEKREREAAEEEARLEAENNASTQSNLVEDKLEGSSNIDDEPKEEPIYTDENSATPEINDSPSDYQADLDPDSYTANIEKDEEVSQEEDEETAGQEPDAEITNAEKSDYLPELNQSQIEAFTKLTEKYKKHGDLLRDENSRRHAFILPFIKALGYDVFDPDEVEIGFSAIGRQADYAIKEEGKYKIFITLCDDENDGQRIKQQTLACLRENNYAIAIITDGNKYHIYNYNDIEAKGPLITYKIDGALNDALVTLSKDSFSKESLLEYGKIEKAKNKVFDAVFEELSNPTDSFVDTIAIRLMRKNNIIIPSNLGDLVKRVTQPLVMHLEKAMAEAEASARLAAEAEDNDDRIMTEEENEAFEIIKLICSEYTDPENIVARPAKSYLAILLHDNNRRTIARLHFNYSTKYIGTFVEREETRNKIENKMDVINYRQQFIKRMHELDPSIDINSKETEA